MQRQELEENLDPERLSFSTQTWLLQQPVRALIQQENLHCESAKCLLHAEYDYSL